MTVTSLVAVVVPRTGKSL